MLLLNFNNLLVSLIDYYYLWTLIQIRSISMLPNLSLIWRSIFELEWANRWQIMKPAFDWKFVSRWQYLLTILAYCTASWRGRHKYNKLWAGSATTRLKNDIRTPVAWSAERNDARIIVFAVRKSRGGKASINRGWNILAWWLFYRPEEPAMRAVGFQGSGCSERYQWSKGRRLAGFSDYARDLSSVLARSKGSLRQF
jgi:hypothetical protein